MPHIVPQPVRDEIKSAILALNNAHAVELSWLNARQLEALLQMAFYARQIGNGDAFLIAFDHRQRYRRFVYIDRVMVSPLMQGRG